MMNKDDANNDTAAESRKLSMEIMDTTSDDRKPAAKAISVQGPLHGVEKRKRKSPEKPWKKPPDMPKRPLSAYNIFFKDERERLLGAGSEGKPEVPSTGTPATSEGKIGGGKKNKRTSGIGFANLAKTIAARWNELGDDIKAPYEEIAATEKKKYDELVAEWRIKQAAKKKALAQAKKEAVDEHKANRPSQNLYSSDRSLGSFSDTSNPYPSEWFHSAQEHDVSERDDPSMSRGAIPPMVDTAPGSSYDKRMYGIPMTSHGWQHSRHDPGSYYHRQSNIYDAPDPYSRYSPEDEQAAYMSQFPHDSSMRGSSPLDAPSVYRDYFHHSQQPMYHHQSSSRRGNDMRMSRAASLPSTRHGASMSHQHVMHRPTMPSPQEQMHQHDIHQEIESNVAQFRQSRESLARHHRYPNLSPGRSGSSMVHPRSSSMPYIQHSQQLSSGGSSRRRRIHPVSVSELMPPPPNFDEMNYPYGRSSGSSTPMDMSGQGTRLRHSASPTSPMIDPDSMHMAAGISTTTPTTPSDVGVELSLLSATTPSGSTAELPILDVATTDAERQQPSLQQQQRQPQDETSTVQTSLYNTLNESLDEDAISFITSMKYS